MIINFNKIFSIYLILILFSCSKSELSDNLAKDVHDQLSTNVEITLTKKGNITAKIKSEILKKNNQSLQLELYNNCLLYTSPSPRDGLLSRMPSSA